MVTSAIAIRDALMLQSDISRNQKVDRRALRAAAKSRQYGRPLGALLQRQVNAANARIKRKALLQRQQAAAPAPTPVPAPVPAPPPPLPIPTPPPVPIRAPAPPPVQAVPVAPPPVPVPVPTAVAPTAVAPPPNAPPPPMPQLPAGYVPPVPLVQPVPAPVPVPPAQQIQSIQQQRLINIRDARLRQITNPGSQKADSRALRLAAIKQKRGQPLGALLQRQVDAANARTKQGAQTSALDKSYVQDLISAGMDPSTFKTKDRSFLGELGHNISKVVKNPADALLPQHVRESAGYRTGVRPIVNVATDAAIGFATGGPAGAIAAGFGGALNEAVTGPKGYGGVKAVLSASFAGYAAGASDAGTAFNETLANGGTAGEALNNAITVGANVPQGATVADTVKNVLTSGDSGKAVLVKLAKGLATGAAKDTLTAAIGGAAAGGGGSGGTGGTGGGAGGAVDLISKLASGAGAVLASTGKVQQKPGVANQTQLDAANAELTAQTQGTLGQNLSQISNDPNVQAMIAARNKNISDSVLGNTLSGMQQGLSQIGGFGGSVQNQQQAQIAAQIALQQGNADNAILTSLAQNQLGSRYNAATALTTNNQLITPPNRRLQQGAWLSQLGAALAPGANGAPSTIGSVINAGIPLVQGAWDIGKSIIGGIGDFFSPSTPATTYTYY